MSGDIKVHFDHEYTECWENDDIFVLNNRTCGYDNGDPFINCLHFDWFMKKKTDKRRIIKLRYRNPGEKYDTKSISLGKFEKLERKQKGAGDNAYWVVDREEFLKIAEKKKIEALPPLDDSGNEAEPDVDSDQESLPENMTFISLSDLCPGSGGNPKASTIEKACERQGILSPFVRRGSELYLACRKGDNE